MNSRVDEIRKAILKETGGESSFENWELREREMTFPETLKKACKHENIITTDLGFRMCSECEWVIETPSVGDLASAELRGAL